MSPAEAAKLLEIPADATSEQVEARFQELRRKIEDKIAKAPTPGLQSKYRDSLAEITTAFETLTLAADSSALPVLRKNESSTTAGGGPASTPATPLPRASSGGRKPDGSREFAIVAVIAILALAGGGWLVMKTRAENAGKERIAAAAKAEAEKRAEQEILAAAAKRQAEEAEKARLAAAARGEQERLDKLTAEVRVKLAEAKLAWDLVERERSEAEKALADLKGEERSARDATPGRRAELAAGIDAQTKYNRWLANFIASHPARRAMVRASELLNAKQSDDAAAAASSLGDSIASAQEEINATARRLLQLEAQATINAPPEAQWTFTDAFGREYKGQGQAVLSQVAIGPASIRYFKSGWPVQSSPVLVASDGSTMTRIAFASGSATVTSDPPGADVFRDGVKIGTTPLEFKDRPPGTIALELRLAGYETAQVDLMIEPGQTKTLAEKLWSPPTKVKVLFTWATEPGWKWITLPRGVPPSLRSVIEVVNPPRSSGGKILQYAIFPNMERQKFGLTANWRPASSASEAELDAPNIEEGGAVWFTYR